MVKQLTANSEQLTAMWLGIGTSLPWDRLKRKAASGLCRLQPVPLAYLTLLLKNSRPGHITTPRFFNVYFKYLSAS